jgi:hypothetical protein
MMSTGRRPTRAQWIVVVVIGLGVLTAAGFGAAGLFSPGNIAATLPAEPLRAPSAELHHTVMILDAGEHHFVLRHGIQGNRQFFIVSSVSGTAVNGDELSVYDKGTFTGAAQLKSGKKITIKDVDDRQGYLVEGGQVLGWEHGKDTWAVIRSHTPENAQQRLLNLAEKVVSNSGRPLWAPFSMSYAPQGFIPTHASRNRLDRDGEWVFGLSKGAVKQEAPLTVAAVARRDGPDDAEMLRILGKPDSSEYARQLWRVKPGTDGFSVPPGGAEIVLRREGGCYLHIRIADVNLIPPAEQQKIADGIILGLCGDTRGWSHPFTGLRNL